MGGPSSEHDISLLSGLNVLRALRDEYEPYPILITKSGAWLAGEHQEWATPVEALSYVDVVFNALHGEFGEDGGVQNILRHSHVPYTGSEPIPSSLAMNKIAAQRVLEASGVKMPRSMVLGPTNIDTRTVLAFGPAPWIVKPLSRGSSLGVSKVSSQRGLIDAFQKALSVDPYCIVQEYIPGREITCGVLEGLSPNGAAMALAPIEIVPPKGTHFFDYAVKYNGTTKEVCPADFHDAMLKKIQGTALAAHHALGLRHYSRTDMIIKPPERTGRAPELYVLEVNSLPGLTAESLFPKAARHAGLEFKDLVSHLIRLAHI